MFIKYADAAVQDIYDTKKTASLFEEILSNNTSIVSKASVLPEDHPTKQNYNMLRRIAEKRKNLLAVATRAISAYESYGPNKNGDAFERDQLVKFYKTFVLKPHVLDHKLEIPYVRGIIADARWNAPKDYVETLIFIDRENFPKYAKAVEEGIVNSFSMGVTVDEAECSVCGNKARTPEEFCEHIPRYKNLIVEGKQVFEFNRGLTFIEQSAVASPADPDSHTLYIIAKQKNLVHPEIEKLKKLANLLDSYTPSEKAAHLDEYLLLETYANRLADRIATELNIPIFGGNGL